MEENIMNEVVEKAEEQLVTAAENMDKVLAETVTQLPTVPAVAPKKFGLKNLLVGGGLVVGGGVAGFAIDRWVLPAVNNKIEKFKANREKKKAEKKAKAAAKKAAKEQKPTEAPAPTNDDAGSTPDEKKD